MSGELAHSHEPANFNGAFAIGIALNIAFVDKHLAEAVQKLGAARHSVPDDTMNFDRALRVLEECRAAIQHTQDIDLVATHLRAASRALEHYCSGPTKACVSSAIHLIDKAIGGELF
jgi:hypothetical protein